MSISSDKPARVVVIGAGIGGLTAALLLAAEGYDVTVVERAAGPGGKMREVVVGGAAIDAGPTVFTLKGVFEAIFADAGFDLDEEVRLRPASTLARHAWGPGKVLDLHADLGASAAAIGAFAGPAEARRYLEFCGRAARIYRTLDEPFMRAQRPDLATLMRRVGIGGLGGLWQVSPFATLWSALGQHFHDPRLRQLFGRYATYCGSSPFMAPATLMLVAHVEQEGVWYVEGGMRRLADALLRCAKAKGAKFRFKVGAEAIVAERDRAAGVVLDNGERLVADAVVCNADVAALADGRIGGAGRAVARVSPKRRSLSAVTFAMTAKAGGFAPARHNVFFSNDYRAEFEAIFGRDKIPDDATVYVCAQDRFDADDAAPAGVERLLCLVNAPAIGDRHRFNDEEIETCMTRTLRRLERSGLTLQVEAVTATTPDMFETMFPATGGALYGAASHGWTASFDRPGARTKLKGLYAAGGSVHPGPGVPMAALSGRLAASALMADRASI